MLTIKRRKSRSIKTVVPAHTSVDVSKAVEAIVSSHNPAKALASLRATKRFVLAKLNGSPTPEAKALAGISNATKVKDIIEGPIAKAVLEEVLANDPQFSDQGIMTRLREFWDSKDDVFIPVGNDKVIHRKKPNWDVRKFAFTNVLELRGLKKKEKDNGDAPQATQIIFNVTPIPGQQPIEVKAENIQ